MYAMLFYFILFYFILFYFILFYFILFYFHIKVMIAMTIIKLINFLNIFYTDLWMLKIAKSGLSNLRPAKQYCAAREVI